jgi:hypothetical protein
MVHSICGPQFGARLVNIDRLNRLRALNAVRLAMHSCKHEVFDVLECRGAFIHLLDVQSAARALWSNILIPATSELLSESLISLMVLIISMGLHFVILLISAFSQFRYLTFKYTAASVAALMHDDAKFS